MCALVYSFVNNYMVGLMYMQWRPPAGDLMRSSLLVPLVSLNTAKHIPFVICRSLPCFQ